MKFQRNTAGTDLFSNNGDFADGTLAKTENQVFYFANAKLIVE